MSAQSQSALARRLGAEALGTAILLAAVVGSGIMAERLAGGNGAVALLCNSLATGAALFVLITMLGPVSGAHFNPAVSLISRFDGTLTSVQAAAYATAQLAGAVAGVVAAHLMFELPVFQISDTTRSGAGQVLAEAVATFGLVLTIMGVSKARPDSVASAVGLYVMAAYWFTASTSFANPAVTLARAWTDTFAGIRPADTPAFMAAQLAAACVAWRTARWLFMKDGDWPAAKVRAAPRSQP